jgi:hypothetical protein
LVSTDPYDWSDEFTPESRCWMESRQVERAMRTLGFVIENSEDSLPFIEKLHSRKMHVFLNHIVRARKK